MNGTTLVTMPVAGELTVWRLVEAESLPPRSLRRWWMPACVFGIGLLVSGGAAVALWQLTQPDTIIRTRIVADGAGDATSRAALSDLALRLTATPNVSTSLQDGGAALVVTAQDHDPATAHERSQSVVDAILNATIAASASPAPAPPVTAADAVRAERRRLAAAADAVEARAAAISASLTALTRDMASATRSADEHRPGRETLDKGNAALADLELQRLQLVSKYQDTYPAVVALDGQIRTLRVFLMDEAHRIDAPPASPSQSNALLAGERDRLLAELSQVNDRRQTLAAELTGVDRRLTTMPVATAAVMSPRPITVSPPVLVAAATTSFGGADARPVIVPAIAVAGLVLSALASVFARRRRKAFPHRLLLEPVSAGMLAAGSARVLPAALHPPVADGAYSDRWAGSAGIIAANTAGASRRDG